MTARPLRIAAISIATAVVCLVATSSASALTMSTPTDGAAYNTNDTVWRGDADPNFSISIRTIVHNPRSNMNNAVGYARPARFANPVALGTDGIGADMLEEFRLAYARLRESDVRATPETPWAWLEAGRALVPEAAEDRVTWSVDAVDPWSLAFTATGGPVFSGLAVAGDHIGPFAGPATTRRGRPLV